MYNLKEFTDQQLRDEMKRRAKERQRPERCRDCKHCIQGIWMKYGTLKTYVCFKKPKPQYGENRFYATRLDNHACEMYEPRILK